MKLTYTLEGKAKHALCLGNNEYLVLALGTHTIDVDSIIVSDIKDFFESLKKEGVAVEFSFDGKIPPKAKGSASPVTPVQTQIMQMPKQDDVKPEDKDINIQDDAKTSVNFTSS